MPIKSIVYYSAMSVQNLESLVKRLETVTVRLEAVSVTNKPALAPKPGSTSAAPRTYISVTLNFNKNTRF